MIGDVVGAVTITLLVPRPSATGTFIAPLATLTYLDLRGLNLQMDLVGGLPEAEANGSLLHGDGTINEIYLSKVGNKARGEAGAIATVDKQYFERAISSLKGLMAEVYIGLRAKYCNSEPLHRFFQPPELSKVA